MSQGATGALAEALEKNARWHLGERDEEEPEYPPEVDELVNY